MLLRVHKWVKCEVHLDVISEFKFENWFFVENRALVGGYTKMLAPSNHKEAEYYFPQFYINIASNHFLTTRSCLTSLVLSETFTLISQLFVLHF